MAIADVLIRIVDTRKERLQQNKKNFPFASLEREVSEPGKFFNKDGATTVIAECKKGSPSKGVMIDNYIPEDIAVQYRGGGASAVSVLTEPDYFFGLDDHLVSVRKASGLPVLRKDFIFDPYQVRESWALGADCILLIAAILSGDQIKELAHYAQELKMEVLLEAHNEEELQKVLSVPSGAVGINSRNLKNFTTDLDTAKNLCRMIPADRIAVAESGIHSSQDGVDLLKTGFRAFLVGEYFIKSEDRQSCVRNFVDAVS